MDAHVCAGTSAFLSPVYGISSVDSKCLSQSSLLKQTISLNLEHTSVAGLEGQFVRNSVSSSYTMGLQEGHYTNSCFTGV